MMSSAWPNLGNQVNQFSALKNGHLCKCNSISDWKLQMNQESDDSTTSVLTTVVLTMMIRLLPIHLRWFAYYGDSPTAVLTTWLGYVKLAMIVGKLT